MTLYDQYPHVWDHLHAEGYTNLVAVSRMCTTQSQMNMRLGYANAVKNWVAGRLPRPASERRAREVLEQLSDRRKEQHKSSTPASASATASAPAPAPASAQASAQASARRVVMMAGTEDVIAKMEKLAAMLGAECVEI